MSIRIHALAKELNVQSKELIDFINKRQDIYHLEIKTPSNAIDPFTAEAIGKDFAAHAAGAKEAQDASGSPEAAVAEKAEPAAPAPEEKPAKAEEGLIGLVMADPTLFQDMDGLQPEDFSAPALGNLYRQAKTLWETTGSITLSAMAQGLSGAEMNLLASLMQKPQMLGEARQAIADYSRQIRTQKWKREMTKDRDILSFAIEKNGRNPNE